MMRVCLALLVACSSAPPKQTSNQPAAKQDDPSCPLLVPGTSISVEDTPSGAALVFVTTGDTTAVRTRAITLAAMHTKHDGPPHALGMMFSGTSTATESDVEHGARVEFNAKQPDSVGALQAELRMHAGHLTSGTCEM
jgi:hypothetical protein